MSAVKRQTGVVNMGKGQAVPVIAPAKVQAKVHDIQMSPQLKAMCIPIDSVKLWDKNPRKNDQASRVLADLIREHGWRKPIVVDQQGIIRAGNTAYKAARLLGMKVIPALRDSFKSETAAVAYGISDNKASEMAAWDDAILRELLEADDVLKNRKVLGFTDGEFNEILLKSKEAEAVNADDYEDLYYVKVERVTSEDKDAVVTLINSALKEGGYNAYKATAY